MGVTNTIVNSAIININYLYVRTTHETISGKITDVSYTRRGPSYSLLINNDRHSSDVTYPYEADSSIKNGDRFEADVETGLLGFKWIGALKSLGPFNESK